MPSSLYVLSVTGIKEHYCCDDPVRNARDETGKDETSCCEAKVMHLSKGFISVEDNFH